MKRNRIIIGIGAGSILLVLVIAMVRSCSGEHKAVAVPADKITKLEQQVASLQQQVVNLQKQLGEAKKAAPQAPVVPMPTGPTQTANAPRATMQIIPSTDSASQPCEPSAPQTLVASSEKLKEGLANKANDLRADIKEIKYKIDHTNDDLATCKQEARTASLDGARRQAEKDAKIDERALEALESDLQGKTLELNSALTQA